MRVALAGLRATVAALRDTIAARVVEDSAGVRPATFTVDTVPYHGRASVSLPEPLATGTLALDLALDPAPLTLRLYCTPGDGGARYRRADAVATAPPWLALELTEVRASPEV